MKVFFAGVDSWNRPIFKVTDKNMYFGSTSRLLDFEATEQEALDRVSEHDLEYFGTYFDCEPNGGRPSESLVIVTLDSLRGDK